MIRLFLAILLTLMPLAAEAVITSSAVSPTSKNVAPNVAASFPVIWTNNHTPPAAYTVTSTSITIRLSNLGGPVLGVIQRQLRQSFPAGTSVSQLRENLTIPREYIVRAQKEGEPLHITRIFTDGVQTEDASLLVNVISSAAADFSISALDLSFDDGALVRVAEPGDNITALARLSTIGNGRISAAWQVRPQGSGAFRTLRVVNAQALAGQPLELRSPPLPTERLGENMEVRLHLLDPSVGYAEPTIRLALLSESGLAPLVRVVPGEVKVLTPAANSRLDGSTEIKWERKDSAKAYRIEVLPAGGGRTPIAQQMAQAGSTGALLSALSLSKLKADSRYTVRVIAQE
jgi:hypothetical protein